MILLLLGGLSRRASMSGYRGRKNFRRRKDKRKWPNLPKRGPKKITKKLQRRMRRRKSLKNLLSLKKEKKLTS